MAGAGRPGIQFWQHEFLPTFARYNVLSLGAVATLIAFDAGGFPSLLLLLSVGLIALLVLRDRELNDRKLVATICALSTALDARDLHTKGHSDRVASYAVAIATRLGWSTRDRRELEIAAHLHDVGKIGIPDAVLREPGRLTAEKFEVIKTHAGLSAGIVRDVPDFQTISAIIHQHHERLDGSGYPDGVAGDQLVLAARMLGVADSFDAMTSNRPYREAMAPQTALDELTSQAGSHYDPEIVAALCDLFRADELEAALQFGYCLTH